jgi:2-polyprenyl-3-methyl-5-hydroxy-6-metoxy-1,4-benzoquinol methylase
MINIPENFQKNHPNIAKLGYENTGEFIINQIISRTNKKDLSESDVLDIGCGARFSATFINKNIPVQSYYGLDLDKNLIEYLKNNINDSRFNYDWVNYQNDMYNKNGEDLSKTKSLPVKNKKFDLILMFSVVTHQNPTGAENLFRLSKKHVEKNGYLIFSAFIDNDIEYFLDKHKEKPLLEAYYNTKTLEELLKKTGWEIKNIYPPDAQKITQHFFVCSPN